jgi:hypothetical protein
VILDLPMLQAAKRRQDAARDESREQRSEMNKFRRSERKATTQTPQRPQTKPSCESHVSVPLGNPHFSRKERAGDGHQSVANGLLVLLDDCGDGVCWLIYRYF